MPLTCQRGCSYIISTIKSVPTPWAAAWVSPLMRSRGARLLCSDFAQNKNDWVSPLCIFWNAKESIKLAIFPSGGLLRFPKQLKLSSHSLWCQQDLRTEIRPWNLTPPPPWPSVCSIYYACSFQRQLCELMNWCENQSWPRAPFKSHGDDLIKTAKNAYSLLVK